MSGKRLTLFYIYLRKPLAKGTYDLIVDGAGGPCDIIGKDGMGPVGTHYYDFIADFYIRHIGYIYHALIHAYVAGYWSYMPIDDHLGILGVRPRIAVGIAKSQSCDLAWPSGDELSAVTYGESFRNIFKVNDVGFDRHHGFDRQFILVHFV